MIQEKLMFLKDNNVIADKTFIKMKKVLYYLRSNSIILEDDEADSFITHLAMAISRINEDKQIDYIDESIIKEIKSVPEFKKAIQLWDNILKIIEHDFSKAENDLFYLHLVTLLQKRNEGKE